VSPADLWLILGVGSAVTAVLGLFRRPLFAITLNEDLARTSGVSVGRLNLLLTVLTALTTVVAMRMVGVLLVSAMIVVPTLTGFAGSRSFRQATGIAVASALVAVAVGLAAAYYLGVAAGGAIVLTALLLFGGVSLVVRVGRHPVALAWRRRRP
jgi:zinc transport system permease protein